MSLVDCPRAQFVQFMVIERRILSQEGPALSFRVRQARAKLAEKGSAQPQLT